MKYRPEIDGLRCIAVLSVLFFHAGFHWFSGGFIGVDVFFVISGYLITLILIEDIKTGNFNLVNFYERRARRILPALFFVLLVTSYASFYTMIPSDFNEFNKSLISVILYVSNFHFWQTTSYFGTESDLKPLLHTWSLSVEEQFYIFFPLILFFLWKNLLSKLQTFIIAAIILGILLAQYTSVNYPTAGFFLLPTRAWELLVGSLVAINTKNENSEINQLRFSQVISFVGLLMIGSSLILFNSRTPFPSVYTILPVAGTALVLQFSSQKNTVGLMLSNKLLVNIGLVSYSLYLWHQPLYALARISKETTSLDYLLLITLSFLLAYFTYRFIEKPFRNKKVITRKYIFIFCGVSSLLFVLFAKLSTAYPEALYSSNRYQRALDVRSKMVPSEGLSSNCEISEKSGVKCKTSDTPEILIWGDSHAMHLVDGFLELNPNLKFAQATMVSCGPVIDLAPIQPPARGRLWAENCLKNNNLILSYLRKTKSIKFVILSSPLDQYVGKNIRLRTNEGKEIEGGGDIPNYFVKTLEQIKQLGVEPIFISAPPRNGKNLGLCLERADFFNENKKNCNFPQSVYESKYQDQLHILSIIQRTTNVVYLSDYLCSNGECNASYDENFIYRDSGHLTKAGSYLLAQKVDYSKLLNLKHAAHSLRSEE